MNTFSDDCAKTRRPLRYSPRKRRRSSITARSITNSPMATPMLGIPPIRRWKTPNGRFWMGNGESGATSTKERSEGSCVSFMADRLGERETARRRGTRGLPLLLCGWRPKRPRLEQAQLAEVLPRLVEGAAAEGDGEGLARGDDLLGRDPEVLEGEPRVVEREGLRGLAAEDLPERGLAELERVRQHGRAEHVQEAVAHHLQAAVVVTDRVVEPSGGL